MPPRKLNCAPILDIEYKAFYKMKKIISGFSILFLVFFALPASAQTWQKQGKVMVPIVSPGGVCNLANDTVGISVDRATLLTCQSNVWKTTATPKSAFACGSYFLSSAGAVCVERSNGKWHWTNQASDHLIKINSNWPAEWSAGTEEFDCDAYSANGSTVGTACFAPSSHRYCILTNTSSAWYCVVKAVVYLG